MIKLEHIEHLMENIRLGLYKSENYKINCYNSLDSGYLTIECVDKHTGLTIQVNKLDVNDPEYYINYSTTTSYVPEISEKISEDLYNSIMSYIIEKSTADTLIEECITIDALNL